MQEIDTVLREFMDENADALAHAALSDLIAERDELKTALELAEADLDKRDRMLAERDRLREALERIAKADTRYWQGLIAQTALSTQGDDE